MSFVLSKKITRLAAASILILTLLLSVIVGANAKLHAAALTQVLVRFDRMKISTPTTGTVCAKPATASTEADVQVTFPTGYTLGAFGTFTVNTTNLSWPATATAWLGINTATNVTGQVVTFPSTDLVVGTLYCFNWINTAAVSVKSSATSDNAGTVATRATGPTAIDSSSFATASIADDQISVTASVLQTFSFALSANSDALGTLTTGAISTSPTPRTATVNTNAKNGWYVWARDTNSGLNSSSAAYTIGSVTPGTNNTLVAGTEGYNTGVTQSQVSGSGTITVAAPYVGGVLGKGSGLDTSLRVLASSNGTANTAVLTINNNAAISGVTASASDYTDLITVVGAGLF